MKARTILHGIGCVLWAGLAMRVPANAAGGQEALWSIFKERFVTPEGRIVDTGNGGISHSEGQGYGLILAEAHRDLDTFERIWTWTKSNLACRDDALFAWRWEPGSGVTDKNDASDGDLLIAWALVRAADAWDRPAWRERAIRIARAIRENLCQDSSYGILLSPGKDGFHRDEGSVVNLSYWLFPAFPEIAEIDPSPTWEALTRSGIGLVQKARFSNWELPPDWLAVEANGLSLETGYEPVYGYNAIRVPLHLAWASIDSDELLAPFRNFNRDAGVLPPRATVALPSGKLGESPALPGMQAIYRLIAWRSAENSGARFLPYLSIAPDEPYYSVSLGLLANLAANERNR